MGSSIILYTHCCHNKKVHINFVVSSFSQAVSELKRGHRKLNSQPVELKLQSWGIMYYAQGAKREKRGRKRGERGRLEEKKGMINCKYFKSDKISNFPI